MNNFPNQNLGRNQNSLWDVEDLFESSNQNISQAPANNPFGSNSAFQPQAAATTGSFGGGGFGGGGFGMATDFSALRGERTKSPERPSHQPFDFDNMSLTNSEKDESRSQEHYRDENLAHSLRQFDSHNAQSRQYVSSNPSLTQTEGNHPFENNSIQKQTRVSGRQKSFDKEAYNQDIGINQPIKEEEDEYQKPEQNETRNNQHFEAQNSQQITNDLLDDIQVPQQNTFNHGLNTNSGWEGFDHPQKHVSNHDLRRENTENRPRTDFDFDHFEPNIGHQRSLPQQEHRQDLSESNQNKTNDSSSHPKYFREQSTPQFQSFHQESLKSKEDIFSRNKTIQGNSGAKKEPASATKVTIEPLSPKQGIKRRTKSMSAGKPRVLRNESETLDIQCSIHEGQFIERICTHPKYSKKRLLCWECSIDKAIEIQRYRNSLVPITQYALQNIDEYSDREDPVVPQEFQKSLDNIESLRDTLTNSISKNINSLRESLDKMKAQVLKKFDEINQVINSIANEKVKKFDNNKAFFEKTLKNYYPNTPSAKIPRDTLFENLLNVETEAEFNEYIQSLKSDIEPASQEVKQFLRVLSHKIDTQGSNLPNNENFTEINSRNAKFIKLQEQMISSLDGVKSSVSELLNSAYNIEDVSQTRVASSQNMTPDGTNVLIPLNRLSNELLRYKLGHEKDFLVPNPKTVTCIVNIDNEIMAAGSLDKTITFWRISTSELIETISAHDDTVSGLYNYRVSLEDLKKRVPETNSFNEEATNILVSTGGKFDNSIIFWDISWMHDYIKGKIKEKRQTKVIRRLQGHDSGVTAVLPMIDGATLISGAYDGKITVWNVLRSKIIGEIQHHTSVVQCLRLMRCNERFASASWDKTICIWRILYKNLHDEETGIRSERMLLEGIEMEKIIDPSFKITCLNASSVMKNWLIIGGTINRVIVWDIDEGRMVKEFECENNNLADIVLVEDEQREKMVLFGICDDDDVIRGWDSDYQESKVLLREAYNLKNRKKLYASKTSISGSMLQFIYDGRLKIGVVNCAEKKNLVSLWEINFS